MAQKTDVIKAIRTGFGLLSQLGSHQFPRPLAHRRIDPADGLKLVELPEPRRRVGSLAAQRRQRVAPVEG